MRLNIYIDADVIVASEIKKESHHKESKEFMDYVLRNKNQNLKFFTSIFTLLELTSAMIRRTKSKDKTYSLLYRVTKSWKNFINPLAPMGRNESFQDFIDALIEMSIMLKTPAGDTIHAYTFKKYDMNYLITWNVPHFSRMKKKMKDVEILTPTDILKEFKSIKKEKRFEKRYELVLNETLKRLFAERNKLVHNR